MKRFVTGVFALSTSLWAQTTGTATLVGTVFDQSGARVAGAQVTVVNTATSFTSNTVTTAEGDYYVPYLIPGPYRLTVEAPGFKRYVRDGIVLRMDETPRIDVQLQVGAVTETIAVTAEAPLLETETAATGQILGGDTIVKIPVLQKYAFRILLYFPGTTNINGQHIVGQRERAMGYTLDGVSGKEPVRGPVGATNQVVSTTIDAFQEVKVWTTGMPAEFGHAAGGLMSIVYKSGTNEFHGALEDRYIHRALIHRHRLERLPRTNPFGYHELSAVLSGPTYLPRLYNGRDRTFWLFGFQRHHEKASETFIGNVPSPEMLAGDFSFGGLGNPIYDPATTRQDATGRWVRDPFPNNRIPQARFDPVARNFLAQNPYTPQNQPGYFTRTGVFDNLVTMTKYRSYRTRFDGKIDHQLNPAHRLFVRYSHVRHRAWADRWNPQIQWREFDSRAVPIPIDQRNVVLSDTYTFTPTVINEMRFGYNRRRFTRAPSTLGQGWAGKLGIPNVGLQTFPHFVTSTGGLFYRNGSLGRSQDVGEDFTFQENLTKVAGRHTFKFGYELIRTRYNSLVETLPSGIYYMGGTEFPFAPAGTTGNDFAALLLGSVVRADFTQNLATWLPRWWSHAWYVQTDFRPARGLTLNLGLRWSYESPFRTKYGQQSQFDPTAIDPLTGRRGALLHPKGALTRRDLNNFQPRLGLAWNFHPKFVFRSSFGVIHQDLFTNGLNQNFEEYLATASIQQPPGDPRVAFYLSQGPPSFRFHIAPDGSAPFVGTNYAGRNASWLDPNIQMPYVMNWSAGIQWNFARTWLLETLYMGSRGVRLLNNWDINVVPLNIASDFATLDQIRRAYQNYRPYPHFGAIQHYSNYGDISYHGGTVRVEKRHSAGLTLNAFYTFSKALNNGDTDGGMSGVTYYNRALEKGRANYDIKHRFVSVMVYQLPFGRNRPFMNVGGWRNALFGGWDLAWTQTFQSGPPFSVTFTGSPNVYLPGVWRPNLLRRDPRTPSWSIGPHRFPTSAQIPYLDASAFQYPASFTAGTMGRNVVEAPGIDWTQLSLSKEFPVHERVKFILRWDANNFPFKRPQYGQPNSVYNVGDLANFGRIGTATRGGFSDIGTANAHHVLVLRLEW
ncbi:MAG: carboxypeptidase regulatory-like domain-containing protein [Bryobacterales bacterium]|nr:carboxypeptidase regulatory-like domain-containing protein [Bryobacterales bacterium]